MEKIPKHQNAHRMHNYGAPSAVPACICSFSINGSCCLFNFFSLLIRWLCPYNMFLFREFYFSRMFEENFCAMQNNKAKWSLDCVVLFTLFFLLHSARVCPGACIKWTAGDSCTAHPIRQIFIHFYDLQRVAYTKISMLPSDASACKLCAQQIQSNVYILIYFIIRLNNNNKILRMRFLG